MHHPTVRGFGLMTALLATICAGVESLDGDYVAKEQASLTMTLRQSADGSIVGTLTEPGTSMPLSARRVSGGFAGTIGSNGGAMPFKATLQGPLVIMEIGALGDADRITFSRAGAAQGTAKPATAASPQSAPREPAAGGRRNVVINDQRLSDADLAQVEQAYRVRIEDANYWYDRVLGAWGVKDGPTLGFITPGLNLGGALQPDASGGGTQIFVNGRELHPYDVMALQQITGPISPGRYFITGAGIAGYEGGPPMWNLASMAAESPSSGGGSNTWQSSLTGASGFSDGTTGAVFMPNGGIVSTGQ